MNDEQQIIEPVPTMAGYKKIPTFKLWIANQFPYIETDFDAITNYELLQAVIKYLNTIIENENNVESNVTALYNAFVNLHDYVENYFDNLDVQEEINNKLDKMVEDGTIESILLNYSQVAKVFDTYSDMMLDTSSYVNGMKLKTLGYHYINDGGGAEYFVTNVQNDNKYQISIGTNLWIEMIIKDSVNVKQFGAYGDGVNDDTVPLQKACNVASNEKIPLIIPNNHFRITDKITITNDLYIKGYGNESIIEQTTTRKNIFECLTTIDNLKIENLYLYGVSAPDDTNEYENSCLWLCGCTNSSFRNVKFGISDDSHITLRYSPNEQIEQGNLSHNILIDNCEFMNCTEGSPIELFFAHDIKISNCYFHNNNLNATRFDIRGLQTYNTEILNCKFENSYIAIILANGDATSIEYPKIQSHNVSINNCEFINVRNKAIQTKGSQIDINNCKFINSNEINNSCIEVAYQNLDANILSDCQDIIINNCLIEGWNFGIDVRNNVYNVRISNNQFISNANSDNGLVRIITSTSPHGPIFENNNTIYSPTGTKVHLNMFSGTPVENNKFLTILSNIIIEPNIDINYPFTRSFSTYGGLCYLNNNSVNFEEKNV